MNTESMDTRMIAGLQLKNSIKEHFNTIPLTVLNYVKQSCIQLLFQPDEPCINKTVSAVITAILSRGQLHNWSHILTILIEGLTHTNVHVLKVSSSSFIRSINPRS